MSSIEISEIRSPLVKVSCEYKKTVIHGQEYRIEVKVFLNEEISRVNFKYYIFNKNLILAKGKTEHVFLNNEGKLLYQLPHNILKKLRNLGENDNYEVKFWF